MNQAINTKIFDDIEKSSITFSDGRELVVKTRIMNPFSNRVEAIEALILTSNGKVDALLDNGSTLTYPGYPKGFISSVITQEEMGKYLGNALQTYKNKPQASENDKQMYRTLKTFGLPVMNKLSQGEYPKYEGSLDVFKEYLSK